jgi:hypothetical protein
MDVDLWLCGRLNRDFAVQVDGNTVYDGLLVSNACSRSHARPAIVPNDSGSPIRLHIARTYHAPEKHPDPRIDDRVKDAPAKAGFEGDRLGWKRRSRVCS